MPSAGLETVSAESLTISNVIQYLRATPTGTKLLARAQRRWKLRSLEELVSRLKWSAVSRTDAVLTRHLDAHTGEEVRDREVTIYLKRHPQAVDTILDLAHELTHAVANPHWDPYDPELTVGKYIWHAIEGEGGEVDAVVSECQVALEISQANTRGGPRVSEERCARYLTWDKVAGRVDRTRVQQDFYKVGGLKSRITDMLGREAGMFPLLSGARAELFSSTGKSPYPAALAEEFHEMNRMACVNTRKRFTLLRSPASEMAQPNRSDRVRSRESTLRFLSKRCGSIDWSG